MEKSAGRSSVDTGRDHGSNEEAHILERANQLRAGAPLEFGQHEMGGALRVHLTCFWFPRRYNADPQIYFHEERNRFHPGAECTVCGKTFKDGRRWAAHMMPYDHLLRVYNVSHDAVLELRAHLQAFPAPQKAFDTLDANEVEEVYSFRNIPTFADAQSAFRSTGRGSRE